MAEWRFWLIVQIAVCGLVSVGFLIGHAEPLIYLVLVTVALGTIYRSHQDAKFLERETYTSTYQATQLSEIGNVSTFLDESSESLFRTHIQSLYTIFQAHPHIEQDHLIEILHARLLARNRLVELFSSLLLTLGLIGTIIGLIAMMNGMVGSMRSDGIASVPSAVDRMKSHNITSSVPSDKLNDVHKATPKASILDKLVAEQGPLAGLGIAFNTTLIGAIFGGVILRILSNVIDATITKYVAHIAELTEVHVLPSMRRVAQRMEKSGYYERLA